MVKRQKEKQYQSAREHRANSQLRSGNQPSAIGSNATRKLPFNCCALSLMPFESPVCTKNGIIFEKTAIEPFLAEHKIDPVTGNPMTSNDLIALVMDKDEEGRWQCPVVTKPFADHTKIVAIVQNPPGNEANVYSNEAYQELNVKAKNYVDLTTGLRFNKKKDVIVLNDPNDDVFNKLRDINSFYHIRNQRHIESKAPPKQNIRHSVTASRILDKINTSKKEETAKDAKKRGAPDLAKDGKRLKIFASDVTGVKQTTGRLSGSLTSSAMSISYDNDAREATEEEILTSMFQVMRRRKKKGYVRLQTNLGDIMLEIHCDIVPRTSTNFIKLCEAHKYNGTSFHRLIKNFMIQGGKPPKDADDDDDESFWGGAFRDEFDHRLKHDSAGILSMANAGANTNRRQFFLTFAPCAHLDNKHSVFGVVIGDGLSVLKEMEKIATDKKDRPLEGVHILNTIIVENPVKEAEELERKRIEASARARENKTNTSNAPTEKTPSLNAIASDDSRSQIGRYLSKEPMATAPPATTTKDDVFGDGNSLPDLKGDIPKPAESKQPVKKKFGNFSGW